MTSISLKFLDRSLAIIAGAVLIALLAVVAAGIVSRALGTPFVWTDESASYLMVWLSMLGWMVATRRGVHMRVRALFDTLPIRGQVIVEAVFLLVIAMLGAIIAWQGLHLVQSNADVDAITLPVTLAWLYVPLIPAGLVMLVQALIDLVALRPAGGGLDIQHRSAPL